MLALKLPPKYFLERKMLDIWKLAIRGEKHEVQLLNSCQTDFFPLKKSFDGPINSCRTSGPWAIVLPVAMSAMVGVQ